MKEQIREIIESNDSLVQLDLQNMHCILPEHYDILANEIYQLVSKHQTNSLLIAMLESQLNVEKTNVDSYEYAYNNNQDFQVKQICDVHLLACRKRRNELEKQLNELKG